MLAKQIGAGGVTIPGGVETKGPLSPAPSVAAHELHRLDTFPCRELAELDRKAESFDWKRALRGAQNVSLDVACNKSRLYHTGAIEERIERYFKFVPKEKADHRVLVRFDRDVCQLSLERLPPLHMRGYRLETGKAPLREDLAAALLVASKYDGVETLVDPLCGSGTIPIEAARMFPQGTGAIFGSDRDAGGVEMAKRNSERAGVLSRIVFSSQAFTNALADNTSSAGVVVCNPPYGIRTRVDLDLRNLYSGLWKALKPGWRIAFVCQDKGLAKLVSGQVKQLFETRSGGLKVFGFMAKKYERN